MRIPVASPRPSRYYLVCATPRSGSTLLCETLAATGVAGRPEEYFEAMYDTGRPRHPAEYFRPDTAPEALGYGADQQPGGGEAGAALRSAPDYGAYLDWVLARGTTPNGVFGAKLMWGYIDEAARHLRDLPGLAGRSKAELLSEVFPGARYLHITRKDKVGQAVSMWKALQTAAWREEGSEEATRGDPRYDFEAIHRLHRCLAGEDAAWPVFFAENGIDALSIAYEQLMVDYGGTLRLALEHIGVEPPADLGCHEPRMRRQADRTSAEWVERYEAERSAAARSWSDRSRWAGTHSAPPT